MSKLNVAINIDGEPLWVPIEPVMATRYEVHELAMDDSMTIEDITVGGHFRMDFPDGTTVEGTIADVSPLPDGNVAIGLNLPNRND